MERQQKRRRVRLGVPGRLILGVVGVAAVAFGVMKMISGMPQGEENVAPTEETATPAEDYTASIVMVGDALIHDLVYKDAYGDGGYDFKPQIAATKLVVEKYDLKYYNQETVLGGTELGLSSYPMFNSPQEVGDAFVDSGFNLVSLATNHTMDKGERGVLNSVEYWKKQSGVVTSGQWDSDVAREKSVASVHEVNGIKYAFISYTCWTNGLETPAGKEYLNNVYTPEKATADITAVRDKVDVVIVAMHWGIEYNLGVRPEQEEIARHLASLGVDLIIGAHPHVVEPVEYIDKGDGAAESGDVTEDDGAVEGGDAVKNDSMAGDDDATKNDGAESKNENMSMVGKTLVIYSLGNFISDQDGNERLTGLMMEAKIHKHVDADGAVSVEVREPRAELTYTVKKPHFRVYLYSQIGTDVLPSKDALQNKYQGVVASRMPELTWGLSGE